MIANALYALVNIGVYMVHLNIATFKFNLKALEPIMFPSYKGSTIRGGFGHAFKRINCAIRNKECSECLLKEKCVYSYVFETPLPSGTNIMRKYKSVPHPFIIEPPPEERMRYKPGDDIDFRLILIGRAIDYLPYFIYSFHELGDIGIGKGRGKYELTSVAYQASTVRSKKLTNSSSVIPEKSGIRNGIKIENIIYDSDTKTLEAFKFINISIEVDTSEPNADAQKLLTINFKTPTRISYNQHLAINLEFHVLIRQLLRRLSLLSYFHCGIDKTEWDFKAMIKMAEDVKVHKQALKWYDWERYSARQNTRMKLGGFVGKITFKGDINPFMPLIKAGEILHVGKGTSFGLGKYEIMDGN